MIDPLKGQPPISRRALEEQLRQVPKGPWWKNVIMALSRDQEGNVIGVEAFMLFRTGNINGTDSMEALPEELKTAALTLLACQHETRHADRSS